MHTMTRTEQKSPEKTAQKGNSGLALMLTTLGLTAVVVGGALDGGFGLMVSFAGVVLTLVAVMVALFGDLFRAGS